MAESQEWVSAAEGMRAAGVKRGMFYWYVGQGRIKQDKGRALKDGQFSRADCLQVRVEHDSRRRARANKPDPLLYDWIKASDILATLELDRELFTADETDYEIDYNEPLHYQERQRKNPTIAMGAFTPDRARCLGYVSLIPLPETVILDIMAGLRSELSIQLAEVETYDRPGGYTLFCNSAAVSREQPYLLYKIIRRIMGAWIDRYPEQYVTRIYAQAVSDEGRAMIAHFFMAPMSGFPDNSYYLDFARTNPSTAIRQFIERLEEIAPLPDELRTRYTPPLPGHLQAPAHRPEPRKQIARASQPPVSAAPADLPAGSIHLRDLAAEIGISRSTLYGHVVKGRYSAISIEKTNRPGEHDHYFSEREAERIRADYGKS